MKKDATSTTRTSSKCKQRAFYSPLSHQEEIALARVLHRSPRKIPSNGERSEDDIDNGLSDWEDGVEAEQKETVKPDETKVALNDEIQVDVFNKSTGPKKTLPSKQGVKNFFELMFDNKVCLASHL